MGLESHIIRVLDNEPASGLRHGYDYWFSNGLTCKDARTAEKAAEQLFDSDQFGYTTLYHQPNGEVKIVFERFLRHK